ncbi:MAG: thiamine pyrophosphate-dependent enzyme [Acidiferrobacterales bacterium]
MEKQHVNAGQTVVDTLIAHGVKIAFTVPGESFLTVIDGLRRRRDAIRLISTRHEGGAAFAAEAFGRLTARPAAVFVSRGPGATNASIGVHTAMQGSSPMLLFVGHVRRRSKGREAFQEIEHQRMFAPVAKAVLEPSCADEIAAVTAQALEHTVAGRPGPVVVVLPRDLTEDSVRATASATVSPRDSVAPNARALAEARALLRQAHQPLIIAGEMIAIERASADLVAFAEAIGAPVMTAYRQPDVFPNSHGAYAGHLEINRAPFQREAFVACDLVIALGTRLDGITTEDYTLLGPEKDLIQVYPDTESIRRNNATVGVVGDVVLVLKELMSELAPPAAGRLRWRDSLHAAYLEFSTPGGVEVHGAVDMAAVVDVVAQLLPEDAVVLTDGGSFARWVHRYYRFKRPRTYAGPVSGAMGYAVPGAIGAALALPQVPIVAFVGDGSFMMNGQELMTAVETQLPIKIIVCDNQAQGSILLAQWLQFGESSDYGTRMMSPDFVVLARAYGAEAFRVVCTDDFAAQFEAALAHDGPALIHVITDQRDIAPFADKKDAV